METKNSMQSFTFTTNGSAGNPAGRSSSLQRRRWKTPSQIKRDKKRKDEFMAKKLEIQPALEEKDTKAAEDVEKTEKVLLVKPRDERSLEVCEKVFVIAKSKIDDHNIGIEYDVTTKLEAKEIKVKKVTVERKGNQIHGEFIRCEVLIEPSDANQIEKTNFGIKKCWVLPCT
jgi:hypothetical protein